MSARHHTAVTCPVWTASEIEAVLKIQGTFVAGTVQLVIGPEAPGDLRPDRVVLTNPTYEAEIRTQTASLGLSPTFAAA